MGITGRVQWFHTTDLLCRDGFDKRILLKTGLQGEWIDWWQEEESQINLTQKSTFKAKTATKAFREIPGHRIEEIPEVQLVVLKSEEIQKALRTPWNNFNCRVLKKSPLKNLRIMLKLNNRAWQLFISACPCT
ncbi:hypothetical protein JOQ06_002705 [Pogonophryne albipinna]|uniref:Large ribosomal subunit protein uL4 C-terminal domain-containing protein n=1 Tax=Pogonophryne albipinna TaxID=1090488 RepID=A0AAD6B8A7_9TELE|nr:hypothetical protein JOQ06_002705 [Pogonophryne albipinna]